MSFEELLSTHSAPAANGADLCLLCGKVIKAKMIKRHMRDVHYKGRTAPFKCPMCHLVCHNRQTIYYHVRQHHPEWKGVDLNTFRVKE